MRPGWAQPRRRCTVHSRHSRMMPAPPDHCVRLAAAPRIALPVGPGWAPGDPRANGQCHTR
eukprot:3785600-Prymnesium_polylepis.1